VPSEKSSEKPSEGMVKNGNLKSPTTRCDLCGAPSAVILPSGKARCPAHVVADKMASDDEPLKGAGERLSGQHDA